MRGDAVSSKSSIRPVDDIQTPMQGQKHGDRGTNRQRTGRQSHIIFLCSYQYISQSVSHFFYFLLECSPKNKCVDALAETWRRVWGGRKIFSADPKFLNDFFWEKFRFSRQKFLMTLF